MCLDTVDKKVKKGRGYGYKVFERNEEGKLTSMFGWIRHGEETVFEEEKWLEDKSECQIRAGYLCEGKFPRYKTGYHIAVSKRGAQIWMGEGREMHKVRYNDVVASGKQGGFKVIVARKIYIEKEEVSV